MEAPREKLETFIESFPAAVVNAAILKALGNHALGAFYYDVVRDIASDLIRKERMRYQQIRANRASRVAGKEGLLRFNVEVPA